MREKFLRTYGGIAISVIAILGCLQEPSQGMWANESDMAEARRKVSHAGFEEEHVMCDNGGILFWNETYRVRNSKCRECGDRQRWDESRGRHVIGTMCDYMSAHEKSCQVFQRRFEEAMRNVVSERVARERELADQAERNALICRIRTLVPVLAAASKRIAEIEQQALEREVALECRLNTLRRENAELNAKSLEKQQTRGRNVEPRK